MIAVLFIFEWLDSRQQVAIRPRYNSYRPIKDLLPSIITVIGYIESVQIILYYCIILQ